MNGSEYEKYTYDSILTSTPFCDMAAPLMDSSSTGASFYYSKNSADVGGRHRGYIPTAEGYPFVQTEYTQDNTGRINRQGGVGPNFRLGSNHETKYYYSITPDQNELDALFGTEVGNNTHYFKNFVRDANGQFSVSYVDMHSRTIATALAGEPPSKLKALDSYTPTTITETIADASTNVTKDLVMESHKSLMETKEGDHRFTYSLDPQSFQKVDCSNPPTPICYDCLYDLEITITGDCNNKNF